MKQVSSGQVFRKPSINAGNSRYLNKQHQTWATGDAYGAYIWPLQEKASSTP